MTAIHTIHTAALRRPLARHIRAAWYEWRIWTKARNRRRCGEPDARPSRAELDHLAAIRRGEA